MWAEKHRILGDETPFPGPWRNRLVPYLTGPMDAFSDPAVERIVCCFAAQCGKTEIELNCLGYVIDQDPGSCMVVYDTERAADKTVKTRIHPMILASPALRRHLLGNSDDLGLKEIKLDRSYIYTAWSNSPGALASTAVRNVFLDEVDKYLPFSGREANPIELAVARTRNFRGRRKILVGSTPTLETKYVWSEYQRSDRRHYLVPCPACGVYQVLDFFGGLRWDKEARPEDVNTKGLAWYVCTECHAEIRDGAKGHMLERGVWAPEGTTVDREGEIHGERPVRLRRGFHLNVLYSPFVTWGEVAGKWIEVKTSGDLSLMMDFFNSWLALPWQERIESVTEEKVKRAIRDYPMGRVPAGAKVLTAGVDVQPDHCWFAVRAWGPGMRSWLVRHGVALSWETVWEVLSAPYPSESGEAMQIERALIDSGFKTKEVYEFCQRHYPATLPTKGSNNPGLVASWRMGRPEPGMVLFTFKADHFKDQLSALIGAKPGDPGEWNVYAVEEDPYVRHMVSERRVILRKNGRVFSTWRPLTDSTPNHLWDCEVLNVFAAEMLHVRFLSAEPRAAPAAKAERRKEDDWIEREPGWLDDAREGWN